MIKSNIPVLHNLYKVICTYQLPWCVAGTISVGCRSTGKWTTADAWIIFKVYDCEKRKYWKGKRKHKEERKNRIYVFYKKCGPKLIFFIEKKIRMTFFDIENWLWKSKIHDFWRHLAFWRYSLIFLENEACVNCGTHKRHNPNLVSTTYFDPPSISISCNFYLTQFFFQPKCAIFLSKGQ